MAESYYALMLAIVWYRELSPDEALRAIRGETRLKPEARDITPEMVASWDRILRSPNFRSFNRIERLYKVDRYRIADAVTGYRAKGGVK
jgi:hypothetical protein